MKGISDALIRRAVGVVLDNVGNKNIPVTVHVVGERRMRSLNAKYRGKDKSTDVLSFPLTTKNPFTPEEELGDIFLCPSYLSRQARRFHVTLEEESVRMLIHGTLHLLGYDHIRPADAQIMLPLQEKLLLRVL
jgi:probable rRNA maturation factor